MKKIKLLTPLLSTAAVAGIVLPMASCACNNGDTYIRESKDFQKEQTTNSVARYIFVLDKNDYSKHDVGVELKGQDADKFTVSSFLDNNLLVVELTPNEQPDEGSVTYTIGLSIKVATHKKEVSDLKITVLPGKDEVTVNEHLKYEYDSTEQGYFAYCDLETDEEKALWDVKTLYFPDTYNDGTNGEHPVVGVKENGFENCTSIKKLIIPESVKIINDDAFNCRITAEITEGVYSNNTICSGNITKINFLGESQLETIGNNSFDGHKNIKSITIPKTVKTIGKYAFRCVDIERSLNDFGSLEIYNPVGLLKTIEFEQESVLETIGDQAFFGQKELQSLLIPKTVTTIGNGAFSCIYSKTNYISDVRNSETKSVGSLKSVIFENGSVLKTIDGQAFYGQKELTTIDIPNTVESIGYNTFASLDTTNNIDEGSSITPQGKLSQINIDINNSSLKWIDGYAFAGQKELKSINIPKNCNLSDTDSYNPFIGCEQLSQFNIHNENTNFQTNDSKNVLIAKVGVYLSLISYPTAKGDIDLSTLDAENIHQYCFAYNNKITSVKTSKYLGYFNDYSFFACHNLKKIEIGTGCWTINMGAFGEDYQLVDFIIDSQNKYMTSIKIGDHTPVVVGINISNEQNEDIDTIIAYPSASGSIDLTPSTFDNVKNIAYGGFAHTNIESIKLNSSISTINYNTFYDCYKLKQVNFNKCSIIMPYSFYGCNNLEKFIFEGENINYKTAKNGSVLLTKDGETLITWLLNGCEDVDFTDSELSSIRYFDNYFQFRGKNINLINLGTQLQQTAYGMFQYLNFKNSNITIPDNITSIKSGTFRYCTGIKKITFPTGSQWKMRSEEIDVTDPETNAQNLTLGAWKSYPLQKQ